jgi:hypothetical protein
LLIYKAECAGYSPCPYLVERAAKVAANFH